MAHGFRRERVRRRGAASRGPVPTTYVAILDAQERELLVALMTQVLSIVEPPPVAPHGDEFDQMMAEAGLSHLDGAGDRPSPAAAAGSEDLDDPDRDPALDRLLPDAHREDPLLSAEFRRIAAPGLRARKAANLAAAIELLTRTEMGEVAGTGRGRTRDDVRLTEEEAGGFAVALTDVRLVVGERLQLRDDADAERLDTALATGKLDEPTGWLVAVYDFLTWLQETLTQAMLDRLDDQGR
ncbi:MAG: DUF2017 domain-containing protein [Actinobacteria bacterium]|nr:DUF2017 domain-containing protein [Actinomycetota bacterium]